MQDIGKAVELLSQGELVAFPTETVYGLGADACNESAVKKIFAVKQRPVDHPVIIHIYQESQLKDWVKFIPDEYYLLAKHFWPGAMTLIFECKDKVSPLITGGQKTIGIRLPSHPIARELLKQFGKAIAAPSANRFGKISPTAALHVKEELGKKIKFIIDGGNCLYGIESTIIDVSKKQFRILRPGPLNKELIQQKTGLNIVSDYSAAQKIIMPRVSGNLESHYAPETLLEILFNPALNKLRKNNIALLSFQPKSENFDQACFNSLWITMPDNALYYGQIIYSTLRELDKKKLDCIYVETPPDSLEWQAVCDRLKRAASNKINKLKSII